jgi:GTP diphosphokinase / guanosine-3',5'-bis(diphosphate) 3'-diphosphatase
LPHKPGVLGTVCSLIGLNKGNIINVELIERKDDYLKFSFDLQIKDLKNFTNLISQIKQSNLNFRIIRHKQKKNAFIRRIFENFKRN